MTRSLQAADYSFAAVRLRAAGSPVVGSSVAGFALVTLVGLATIGCGSRALSEPLVPEENQRESKKRYGEQQLNMDQLGQTPSERATVEHHRDTGRDTPDTETESDEPDDDE